VGTHTAVTSSELTLSPLLLWQDLLKYGDIGVVFIVNPLNTHVALWYMKHFHFMISLLAMSLGGRFYLNVKGGTGEDGRVHSKWLGGPWL